MTSRWVKAERIFVEAVALDNSAERKRFVERACLGDESLKVEVEFLLDGHRKAEGFMEVQSSITGKLLVRYKVLKKLAQGMGWVYLAHDSLLNRFVVVKRLPPWAADDRNRKARFLQEARCVAHLDHPNVIRIYDWAEEGEIEFIVMEFVPGETLRERITTGPIALKAALQYSLQIGSGLAEAHKHRIIHRDLKPSNVMITPEGVVKLLDLGLAKIVAGELPIPGSGLSSEPKTREGDVLGTPGYMSPEQAAGKSADHRSDIWGFGVLMYEMLSGRRAFDASSGHLHIDLTRTSRPTELPRAVPPP